MKDSSRLEALIRSRRIELFELVELIETTFESGNVKEIAVSKRMNDLHGGFGNGANKADNGTLPLRPAHSAL
jgi:hypothetical protein